MALALALLTLTYVGLCLGIYALYRAFPGAWPYWIIVTLALGVGLYLRYRDGGTALLASVGAKVVEPGQEPELVGTLHRLAGLADIPAPRLAIASTEAANAFALVWLLVWPLALPVFFVGSLLTLTVSRYREFAGDRGSAILTGAPQQLMSALRMLASQAAEIPHDDLRAADAFCIVPTEARLVELFSDHPSLEKRLEALEEIAR
jgi:Zn-dependent protease with chaperone function